MDSGLVVWQAVVVLALCVAAWARYAMDRNSEEEVPANLRRPSILTALLLVLVVAVSVTASVSE